MYKYFTSLYIIFLIHNSYANVATPLEIADDIVSNSPMEVIEQKLQKLDSTALNKPISDLRNLSTNYSFPHDPLTLLALAAGLGKEDITKLILEYGADINARDGEQWTPLMIAAWMGQEHIAKLLLEFGADPHLTINFKYVNLAKGVVVTTTVNAAQLMDLINISFRTHPPVTKTIEQNIKKIIEDYISKKKQPTKKVTLKIKIDSIPSLITLNYTLQALKNQIE